LREIKLKGGGEREKGKGRRGKEIGNREC